MTRPVHLMLCRPDHPRFRIMDSHLEVMGSLQWGFQACGVDCSIGINRIDPQRQNIVFGWIIGLQLGLLAELPPGSVLYNFEQFSERTLAGGPFAELTQRFHIWDYSAANLPRWQACNPRHTPYHAPVSFAPVLERLPQRDEDIDLLFVGSVAAGRQAKLAEISGAVSRPGVVTLQNVWGATRDEFIARSRLQLNLSNDNPALRIFEVVRVSYYLANRRAVVCEDVPGQFIEDDLRPHLVLAPREQLPATCEQLLADPALRRQWAERGHEAFRQRDVRELVRRWIA